MQIMEVVMHSTADRYRGSATRSILKLVENRYGRLLLGIPRHAAQRHGFYSS